MLIPTPVVTKITDKGYLLIPAKIRKALGMKPQGEVFLYPVIEDKKLFLEPLGEGNIIEMAYGLLKRRKGEKPMTEKLLEERKRDLLREETKFNSLSRGE